MKKNGFVWTLLMMAVIALATTPSAFAQSSSSGTAGQTSPMESGKSSDPAQTGQTSDPMTSGQSGSQEATSMSQSGADYNKEFHATLRGSQIMGKEVVNRNDEQLGEVEDIVIGRDGTVQYVVISHGGVLGIGDNLVPVPFSEVDREQGGEERLILNASKEELENAPSFAQNEWPDFSDQSYEQNVRGYFGTTTGSESGMESKGQMDSSGQMKSSEQPSGTEMKEDTTTTTQPKPAD